MRNSTDVLLFFFILFTVIDKNKNSPYYETKKKYHDLCSKYIVRPSPFKSQINHKLFVKFKFNIMDRVYLNYL